MNRAARVLVAAVATLAAFAESQVPARDLQALLPGAAVAPWSPDGPATQYDRATLSNLVDGAAELFLTYGFSRAVTQEYARGDDSVSCTIYEMASSDAAQGIFAHRLSPGAERLAIGNGAGRSGFQLTFWQGRHYVVIEVFSKGADADRAPEMFARAISAQIGREAGT